MSALRCSAGFKSGQVGILGDLREILAGSSTVDIMVNHPPQALAGGQQLLGDGGNRHDRNTAHYAGFDEQGEAGSKPRPGNVDSLASVCRSARARHAGMQEGLVQRKIRAPLSVNIEVTCQEVILKHSERFRNSILRKVLPPENRSLYV